MWGVLKMEDEGLLCLEVVGDKGVGADSLMIVEFNRVESTISVWHSGSGRHRKSSPRGSEVTGDQEMGGKSNAEVSKTKSERLDSDLVLGRISPNSSLQCLDISLTEIAPSVGKERFLTKLCSLLALHIKIFGSKTSWRDFASGFLLVWVLLAASSSQWIHLQNLCGFIRACTTSAYL